MNKKIIEAFPLQWPAGWKRFTYRSSSKFKTLDSFGKVRDGLIHEVRLMGGTGIILSTNIPITKDGVPYAKHSQPADPGVAIYFSRKGSPMVLACDKWRTVVENVRALQLTVEAMRGIDRWGSSELMERSFTGFAALPPPPAEKIEGWRSVLGLGATEWCDLQRAKELRNLLARKYHPDFGEEPDNDRMAKVNEAYEKAQEELS